MIALGDLEANAHVALKVFAAQAAEKPKSVFTPSTNTGFSPLRHCDSHLAFVFPHCVLFIFL